MADNDELLVHIHYIKRGIDEICDRLDTQNGRIRSTENAVLVLQTKADDAASQTRSSGRNWGAGAGAFIAAVITALWQMLGGGK